MPDEPTLPPADASGRLVAGIVPMSAAPTIAPTGSLSSHDTGAAELLKNEAFSAGSRRLGNYELQEELARGGMGVVFRAKQVSLSRIVALKMILSGPLAGSAALQRFHIEATAAAQLDHPNIVPIYEVGEDAGQHFFSMKLVEGGSVAEHLNRYLSNPRLTAEMLAKVARAVHYAHQRGILHRDLKPANILLDSAGEPLVSDFGLAKWDQADVNLTHAESCLGTPGYMAPEQARGSRGMSTAADIYSLGAILYQCLTGLPPFTGGNVAEVLRKLVEEEPLPPRTLSRNVPLDLGIICLKCLSKEPEKRYPNAEALAEDLDRFVRGEPIAARAVGPVERVWRWCRRKPALASAITAVVLATVLTIVTLSMAVVKISAARTEERRQYAGRLHESANARFSGGDAAQGLLTLTEALSLAEQSGFTSLEKTLRRHIGIWQSSMPVMLFVADHGAPVSSVACTRYRVFTAGEDVIRVWDGSGTQIGEPIRPEGPVRVIAASPQGDLVAAGGDDGRVGVWSVATGERLHLLDLKSPVASLAWNPAGKTLAIATETPSLSIVQMNSPSSVRDLPVTSCFQALRFSEAGDTLLAGATDGSVLLFDLASLRMIASTKLPQPVRALGFQHEDLIAVVTDRATIFDRQLRATTRRETPIPEGTSAIALSAVGMMITGGDESVVRSWDLSAGQLICPPIPHPARITATDCSDDGRLQVIACADGSVRLFSTLPDKGEQLAMKGQAGIQCMTLSRDRTILAAGDASGVISRWKLDTREQLPPIRLGSPVMSLAFGIGGELLAGDQDGKAWYLDSITGSEKTPPVQAGSPGAWLDTISVSPDGKLAVVGFNDGTARIWQFSSQTWHDARLEHQEAITSACFSPDGQKIITTSRDASARLWHADTGSPVGEAMFHDKTIWAALFSDTGDHVVTAGEDRTLRFWDSASGVSGGLPLKLDDEVLLLAADHPGQRLAAGCRNGMIYIWQLTDWARGDLRLLSKVRLNGAVTTLVFSPSGDWLLAGCGDNSARLIDPSTGTLVGVPLWHGGTVSAAAFDLGRGRALTAASDGLIRSWPIAPAAGAATDLAIAAQKSTGVMRTGNGTFQWLSVAEWRKRFLASKPASQPVSVAR